MCGIIGFIGKSVNPAASFALANSLLIKTEIRGEHATGFWSTDVDGTIYYDKEPIKSSIYVTRDIWSKKYAEANADLLLGHCRLSSMGMGHERVNKNNHPHVSSDIRTALVHNGKITEYSALKSRYHLRSDCDSEMLLAMFESGEQYKGDEEYLNKELPMLSADLAYRMMGLKDLFSRVHLSAMAVAIGEHLDNGKRHLWLFRDNERPIHVIDLRESLGQVFFCSTPEIWKSALEACPGVKDIVPTDHVIIEVPNDEVWFIAYYPENADAWTVRKFKVIKAKFYNWDPAEDAASKEKRIEGAKPKVVSRLGENEEIVTEKFSGYSTKNSEEEHSCLDAATKDENFQEGELNMAVFEELHKDLQKTVSDLVTQVSNLHKEKGLTSKDLEIVCSSLKDAKSELQATIVYLTQTD